MSKELLTISDLCVEYRSGGIVAKALNGLNLSINKGEAFGLVGESGAGKTTTALSMLRLLPERVGFVTGGDIKFNGKSIFSLRKKELLDMRGNNISMVFQNPLTSLNPLFTVGEQIAMVFSKHKGMNKKDAMEAAGQMLLRVGIPDYRLSDYPHQFSGGMRQRVGIAAALACSVELLIADEPTTALDVTIQAQILELMKSLQNDNSTSFLMITHNFGIVAELCQKVAVMYGGMIVEEGTVKEVFVKPMHPYTRGLLHAIPKLTGKRGRLESIPGLIVNSHILPAGCKFHPRCVLCKDQCRNTMPPRVKVSETHYVSCLDIEG
jgi:peptide/nickel transport system ATP-binding protein